jgi:hypothetical protein
MENLMKPKKEKIDMFKWSGWIIAVALIVGIGAYLVVIKEQLWFTITTPNAVSSCIEGYAGEHSEADKRFKLKQVGAIVSPLIEEAKKE